MNNEHYCLVWEDAYGKLKVVETCPPPEGSIKLYTHPVKELTDEEILQQALFSFGNESENFDDSYWIDFARAILRKTQKK